MALQSHSSQSCDYTRCLHTVYVALLVYTDIKKLFSCKQFFVSSCPRFYMTRRHQKNYVTTRRKRKYIALKYKSFRIICGLQCLAESLNHAKNALDETIKILNCVLCDVTDLTSAMAVAM